MTFTHVVPNVCFFLKNYFLFSKPANSRYWIFALRSLLLYNPGVKYADALYIPPIFCGHSGIIKMGR